MVLTGALAIAAAGQVALEGTTRFENPMMLPLGFTFNRKDFAAALLAHIAYEPKMVPILAG
jgi:hypothetical protein